MKYNHKHEWKQSEKKDYALQSFFLSVMPVKTFNRKMTVYDIKHLYEYWARSVLCIPHEYDLYVFSDEFIYHAQQHGFKFKQTKLSSHGDPVGYLNISNKDLQRLFLLARSKGNGTYCAPIFL